MGFAIVFQSCTTKIMRQGSEVIKKTSGSTQLSMRFIMLINVKMPTVVDLFTFICRIKLNDWLSLFETEKMH